MNLTMKIIAIPGENTTAHMFFHLHFPMQKIKCLKCLMKLKMLVLNNEVDAGVIIHENRFTYQEKGLNKLLILGDYWETKTQLPIPLGGIVAKKNLDIATDKKLINLLKQALNMLLKIITNS